jgi:hypothetical protein
MNSAKKALIKAVPLMKCGNALEFKQRLQWLSEGMLRNHLESVGSYTINQEEIAVYRKYKDSKLGDEIEIEEELT